MATNRKVILENHPLCCGIYLLKDLTRGPDPEIYTLTYLAQRIFGHTPTQERADAYIKEMNCETDLEYKTRIDKQVGDYVKQFTNRKSYLLCVLNTKEIEFGAEEILLKHGFEVVIPHTRNPTGSGITMYACHLLPKDGREPVKSMFSTQTAPHPAAIIDIPPRVAA